jgi:hypothetical protein
MLFTSLHVSYNVFMFNLWNQLEFLVTKILDGDSHSLFPLIKNKKSLSTSFSYLHIHFKSGWYHRDATQHNVQY